MRRRHTPADPPRSALLPRGLLFALALAGAVAAGCSPYRGIIRSVDRPPAAQGFVAVEDVRLVNGDNLYDCGPEALATVMRHWGKPVSIEELAKQIYIPDRDGTLSITLAPCARSYGLWARFFTGSPELLRDYTGRGWPVIVMVNASTLAQPSENRSESDIHHFFVVTGYHEKTGEILCEHYQDMAIAIEGAPFLKAWEDAGRFLLLLLPPDRHPPDAADLVRRFNAAVKTEQSGDRAAALREYEAIARDDPRFVPAWFAAGNAHRADGRPKNAESAWRRALAADANHAASKNNLAWLLLEDPARVREAGTLAREAVDQLVAERSMLERSGLPDDRLATARSRKDLECAAAWGTLGRALRLAGRGTEALNALSRALILDPTGSLGTPDERADLLLEAAELAKGLGDGLRAREWAAAVQRVTEDPTRRAAAARILGTTPTSDGMEE